MKNGSKALSRVVISTVVSIVLGSWLLWSGTITNADLKIYETEEIPRVYLIAVGTNNVKGYPMKNSERDATTFADEIEKRSSYRVQSGKDAGKTTVQKTVLLGPEVTKEALTNALDSAAREIASKDIFIFHFAGIGQREGSEDFYLRFANWEGAALGPDQAKKKENSISGEMLESYFAKVRAKTKILIFDTGVSDFVCDQGNSFFSQSKGSNSLFIGTRSFSWDLVPNKNHGTVTGILLDALRGAADTNYDGRITAWETLAYLGNVKYDENRHQVAERNVEFCTSTQGADFDLTLTDKHLSETISRLQKSQNAADKSKPGPDRGEPFVEARPAEAVKKREGKDYAVLFAFDEYDTRWTRLSNPQNDTREIARELKDRYKFSEVVVKTNLTLGEFENVIGEYQKRKFGVGDQLFFFFAGHGTATEYNDGFLVAKDSPGVFDKRSKGYFISLDEMLAEIDLIPSRHTMVVLDACFAGRLWKPAISLIKSDLAYWDQDVSPTHAYTRTSSGGMNFSPTKASFERRSDDQLSKEELISRELADRSRVVLTSGWDVVSDGKPGSNSPFAKQFLEALRKGPDENGLVTVTDIMRYVKRAKNKTPPELGIIGKLGEKRGGGFVFCQGGCSAGAKSGV